MVSAGAFGNGKLAPSLPIGPTWFSARGRFVPGADPERSWTSPSACCTADSCRCASACCPPLLVSGVALFLSLLAAYYGGWVDFAISRVYDLSFAFPTILLGIAIGSALAINGINWGPIHVSGSNLWITTGIIAYTTVPYVGRPLRGELLLLRQKPFVEAAIACGTGPDPHHDPRSGRNVGWVPCLRSRHCPSAGILYSSRVCRT